MLIETRKGEKKREKEKRNRKKQERKMTFCVFVVVVRNVFVSRDAYTVITHAIQQSKAQLMHYLTVSCLCP